MIEGNWDWYMHIVLKSGDTAEGRWDTSVKVASYALLVWVAALI